MLEPAIYEELQAIYSKLDNTSQPEFAFGLGLIAIIFIAVSYIIDHQ